LSNLPYGNTMEKIAIFLISLYQALFSPLLHHVGIGGCRYQPTCSEYAKEVVKKYGVKKGLILALVRLSTCHPFAQRGTLQN